MNKRELAAMLRKQGIGVVGNKVNVSDLRKVLGKKATAESSQAEQTGRAIEEAFQKHFPKSLVKATFKPQWDSLTVWFSLVKDIKDLSNGIRDNDPAYSVWQISGFKKDGSSEGQVTATLTRGGQFMVNPAPGSNMAMDSVKLGWRNKTTSPEKLAKYFDDFAAKAKKIMQDNVENAYGQDEQKNAYKAALL